MAFVEALLAIFTAVATNFVSLINTITGIFWTTGADGGSLTVIGGAALVALGIGVISMVIAMVRSVIKGRG